MEIPGLERDIALTWGDTCHKHPPESQATGGGHSANRW